MDKTWFRPIGDNNAMSFEIQSHWDHYGLGGSLMWYGDADKGVELSLQFLWLSISLWAGNRWLLEMHPPARLDVSKCKLWWVKVTNLLIFRANVSTQSVGLGAHVIGWSRDRTGYDNARFGGDIAIQLLWFELGVHLSGGIDREDAISAGSHPLYVGSE